MDEEKLKTYLTEELEWNQEFISRKGKVQDEIEHYNTIAPCKTENDIFRKLLRMITQGDFD